MNFCLSINRVSHARYYSTPIFRVIKYNKNKNTFNNLKNTSKKNTNTNSNTMYNKNYVIKYDNEYKNKHVNKNTRKYKSYDSYKNMYSGLPIYNILKTE